VSLAFTLDGSDSVDLNQKSTETSDLTYDWVCLIITAGANYLDPCGIYDDDAGSQSVLVIAANEMDSVYVYQITLYVTATDGRSDSASVTVYPSGTTIQVGGMSGPSNSQVNFDQKLSVLGEITAAVEVNATWSVAWGTVDFPISLMTNALTSPSHEFSSSQAADGLQFSLGIAPNSFVSGRTYTFTLTGCEPGSTSLCSYSQLDVYINGPPTSGSIIISPEEGAALNTTFSMSAISWIDFCTDYPLQFSFLYQLSSTLPTMSIAGYSGNSYAESLLPAGLSNNNNTVSIIGLVADVFSCATSSTISVRVLDREISNAEIESLLETTVSSFGSTGDTDALFQTLNAASTTLNTINCSLATNCSGIFREDCVTTANTCGSCLYGYIGVVGDSNLPCFNMNLTSGEIGSLCGGPGDCIYGLCENIVDGTGTCTAPPLECVNNCTYHGQCEYVDAGNNLLSSCTIFDVGCSAVCLCDTDFHGQDCSLTEANLTSLDNSRASMCVSLLKAAKVQDNSSALLDTMVSALLQAYSPYQVVSEDATTSCASLLSYLSAVGRLGYIANAQSSTVQFLTNTMSSFVTGTQVQSQRRRRRLSSSNSTSTGNAVGTAVSDMITGLTSGILGGETPTSITSANLRVSVMSPLTSSLSNSSLSPPATAAQSQYGSLLPSVGLAGNGLDACGFSGGYSPLSIMSWGSNPYSTDVPLQSSILRFGTGGTTDSRRKMLETVDVALTFVPLFYISLQFSSKMDLNFTAQRLGLKANITLPQCRFYDGSEYTDCQGCNISSYTDYNVTYGCYDLSVLCSGASSTRHMARRLANGEGAASYAALATLLPSPSAFPTVSLSTSSIESSMSVAVLAYVCVLILLFICGLVFAVRLDLLERMQLDSLYCDSVYEMPTKAASLVWVVDSAFMIPRKFASVVGNELGPTAAGKMTNIRTDNIVNVGDKNVPSMDTRSVCGLNTLNFLGITIPCECVVDSHDTVQRSLMFLLSKHELFNWFGVNPECPRVVRWIGCFKSFLIVLFVVTLFFRIYFPNDYICEFYFRESDCISQQSLISHSGTKCVWSSIADDYGACAMSSASTSATFILVVALICILVSVPIDYIMSYFLEQMAAKWPDFGSTGFSPTDTNGFELPEDLAKSRNTIKELLEALRNEIDDFEWQALAALIDGDQSTPEEEADGIIRALEHIFREESGCLPDRTSVAYHTLSLNPNGEVAPMTILQKLRCSAPKDATVKKLNDARRRARNLQSSFRCCIPAFRDSFIIQKFVMEQFTPVQRFALKKQLEFCGKIRPSSVPLHQFVIGWFVTIVGILFFIGWIIYWCVHTNKAVTERAWGGIYGTIVAQYIFWLNPIKIMILHVGLPDSMRPRLRAIHKTLTNVATRDAATGPADFSFKVCQHTSPACRAARTADAFGLPASKILRLINDNDVLACQEMHNAHDTSILNVITAVPALLSVFGYRLMEATLDIQLYGLICGLALFLSFLNDHGVYFMIIALVLLIAGYLCAWYLYGWLTFGTRDGSTSVAIEDKKDDIDFALQLQDARAPYCGDLVDIETGGVKDVVPLQIISIPELQVVNGDDSMLGSQAQLFSTVDEGLSSSAKPTRSDCYDC
jgi:hypothetical protein